MKKILFSLLLSFFCNFSFAQLNMTLLDHIEYSQDLSALWGWVNPADGIEYALVGTSTGLSIVSLADPQNAVEVGFIPDNSSSWREVKAYGHYAYVVTESVNPTPSGVLVVDLSDAPNSFPYTHWKPNIPGVGTLNKAHSISVDEFGYLYINGSNINNGGVIIADVSANDGNPVYVGKAPAIYCHDSYIRNNILYTSDIYNGFFSVYDVSDKSNIQLLATQETPFKFTHNTWLNDAGTVIFTTDEKANAPVTSYDISDLNNIVELDQFRSLPTIWTGVIPHNVHVWQDWVVTAYYTEGTIIIDGSRPDNLIEVGNFDSFVSQTSGFYGVWEVFPYFPSGTVIASDIENGLLVYGVNYVRACWLEGTVTDAVTGLAISNAAVHIASEQVNEATTDLSGIYKTGQAIPGTFDVTFTASGYYPKTVSATLENGELTILDVALDPISSYSITGQVIKASDGTPVPGAQIILKNEQTEYTLTADGDGNFSAASVFGGNYTLYAGAWGYLHAVLYDINISSSTQPIVVSLQSGYQDDFLFDLGWTNTHTATSGWWVLDKPIGTEYNGVSVNPDADVDFDLGDKCYVTGNGGGEAGDDDVDNGIVTLYSPVMDLTGYEKPILQYSTWFYNGGGSGTPDDALEVRISNGTEVVVLETITESAGAWRTASEFDLANLIALTDNMQVIFETSDLPNNGHLVEAAVDAFTVTDAPVYPLFSASVTHGCEPLTVQFTDNSDSSSVWAWTFEGGSPANSSEQNPLVVFNEPGAFSVTLNVTTTEGNQYILEQEDLIVVLPLPTADFSFSISGGTVSFTNTSESADSYLWDFGDGSTSSTPNPTHTYTTSETYEVTLVATNDCGTNAYTQTVNVQLSGLDEQAGTRYSLTASPNPFAGQVVVHYELSDNFRQAGLSVFNILGEQIANIPLGQASGSRTLDDTFRSSGVYYIRLVVDGKWSKALRVVKM